MVRWGWLGCYVAEVNGLLSAPGEPSKSAKETAAGLLRRLIEVVINTKVFANERHQYKQKSQPVSSFQSFTKVVPLLPAEAAKLRDIYANLSQTEHDDPRRSYVVQPKAVFQMWLAEIQQVDQALDRRRQA